MCKRFIVERWGRGSKRKCGEPSDLSGGRQLWRKGTQGGLGRKHLSYNSELSSKEVLMGPMKCQGLQLKKSHVSRTGPVSIPSTLSHWLGVAQGKPGLKTNAGVDPEGSSRSHQHLCSHIREPGWCIFMGKLCYNALDIWMSRNKNRSIREFPAGGLIYPWSKKHNILVWLEWEKRKEQHLGRYLHDEVFEVQKMKGNKKILCLSRSRWDWTLDRTVMCSGATEAAFYVFLQREIVRIKTVDCTTDPFPLTGTPASKAIQFCNS